MKRKLLLCSFLILLSGGMTFADTEQTVIVEGSAVGKFACGLTFSGNDVTIMFDDGTSQVADISEVIINLTYDTSGIEQNVAENQKEENNRIYNISGQYVGNSVTTLQKGVYVINGKKIIIK